MGMDAEQQKRLAEVRAKVLASKEPGKATEPIRMPPPAPKPPVQPNVEQAAKVATPTPFHPSLKPEFHVFYSRVPGAKFVFADNSVAVFSGIFDPKSNMAIGIYKTPNPAKAKELEGALGQIFFKR